MKLIEVKERTPLLIEQLTKVWESSVKATHLFLSGCEIEKIKKFVLDFHFFDLRFQYSVRDFFFRQKSDMFILTRKTRRIRT